MRKVFQDKNNKQNDGKEIFFPDKSLSFYVCCWNGCVESMNITWNWHYAITILTRYVQNDVSNNNSASLARLHKFTFMFLYRFSPRTLPFVGIFSNSFLSNWLFSSQFSFFVSLSIKDSIGCQWLSHASHRMNILYF